MKELIRLLRSSPPVRLVKISIRQSVKVITVKLSDLRTMRHQKYLRVEDPIYSILRPATISEIGNGLRVPCCRTMEKIESLISPIDWWKTLGSGGRYHIVRALVTFNIEDGPGSPRKRRRIANQVLAMSEQTLNY